MNGFTAADMTTAAANGFRDGLAAHPAAAQEAVVWGIRIGDSDSWGYTNNEEQADFLGKQSGLPYEKKPLYAAPVAAAPKWKHIKTAPADERILVRSASGIVHAANWGRNPSTGEEVWLVCISSDGAAVSVSAIEWMALPAAAASPADGAVLTNPYTGQPRDYRDVESDPAGTLIVEPGKPLKAASTPAAPVVPDLNTYERSEREPVGPTTKETWWAGYRAGKGLPPDTLRSVAVRTPAAPGIDLEQFRPFVELERGFIANRIDRCDAIGTGERLTVLQAELANADRLLRLIDDSRLIDASPKGGIDACAWAGDGEGNWHTACGEIFTLMEGTPTDNKMRHCPYCGKNLRATSADVCVAVISASYEDTRSEARDAARYRWLRNHYEPSFHDSECDSLIGLHGEDLDDAIDDEMQATSAELGA